MYQDGDKYVLLMSYLQAFHQQPLLFSLFADVVTSTSTKEGNGLRASIGGRGAGGAGGRSIQQAGVGGGGGDRGQYHQRNRRNDDRRTREPRSPK
jgi:hypothetical protein